MFRTMEVQPNGDQAQESTFGQEELNEAIGSKICEDAVLLSYVEFRMEDQ